MGGLLYEHQLKGAQIEHFSESQTSPFNQSFRMKYNLRTVISRPKKVTVDPKENKKNKKHFYSVYGGHIPKFQYIKPKVAQIVNFALQYTPKYKVK